MNSAPRRTATATLRMQAVRRVQRGERPEDVASSCGFSRAAVFRWVAAFREGGEAALRTGKAPGRMPSLSEPQRRVVCELLWGLDPIRTGFGRYLWTRPLVRRFVRERFGVTLSLATVNRFLAAVRLLPGRDAAGIPVRDTAIARRALAEGATVGRFTTLRHPGGAAHAVTWTNRSAWFRLYRGSGPASFDDFCRRAVADSPRPVLLVGLPELRELTALSRASCGRLLLWSDSAGDLR